MGISLYPLIFSNMVMRTKSYYIICDYERIYESISTADYDYEIIDSSFP